MSIAADPSQVPPAPEPGEPLIISRSEGAIARITLSRPRAINALNREMFLGLEAALAAARADAPSAIVLDGAGERGFCGGGDIKELARGGAREILAIEYRVDHAVGFSPIPVVGFMDGVTMGGGIGLTGHARHRVVTERSRLAMPEVRIGIIPDVGGHLLLARAPGRLGELLAITAGEMRAGDAIALGFADHYVPSERLDGLRAALASGEDPGTVCARFAEPAPEAPLLATREWWEPIAETALARAADDPKGALLRLLAALDAAGAAGAPAADDAARIATAVRGMCPTSVAVTLAQLDRTRRLGLGLTEVLRDDLRVVGRLAPRADFAEGVRAQVIDKDRDPHWSPATVGELDPAELAEILHPELGPNEPPLELADL
ncbi:enoyl-CoA hydratase/isomerase family protein [Leucobacter ruminantium]|uniref:3-hydroxyisobutyryl-CoA hydrolase n=1 Tax=Leucobacter ruminantium TaxID=1289170 RepID=A0A939LTB6_9MICO|nr:enoyl-CoA hydratase/isomerase family protein [Leucobacter ruminantium]MBO1803731.1 enoyl-CoA hydratase/isomerase family protein [Leucobacter ruminantium]